MHRWRVATRVAAEVLLVDGNPLENLSLVATPETSHVVIMKDGRRHKNLLSQ
jgi:hypothetical protein